MLNGEGRSANGKLGCSKLSFLQRNIEKTRNCLNQLCWTSAKQSRFTATKWTPSPAKAISKRVEKFCANFTHPCHDPSPAQHWSWSSADGTPLPAPSLELEDAEPNLCTSVPIPLGNTGRTVSVLHNSECTQHARAGMAQWIERQPVNQRVTGSIPSQSTCLGCGPRPQ